MDFPFFTKLRQKKAGSTSQSVSLNTLSRSVKLWGRNLLLFHHKRIEHAIIAVGFLLAVLAVVKFLFLWPTLTEGEFTVTNNRELDAEVINVVLKDIQQQKIEHDDEIDLPSRVFDSQ